MKYNWIASEWSQGEELLQTELGVATTWPRFGTENGIRFVKGYRADVYVFDNRPGIIRPNHRNDTNGRFKTLAGAKRWAQKELRNYYYER